MSTPKKPIPRTKAPDLTFTLTNGKEWSLSDRNPENYTMIVFYRGLHCPVCKSYTSTLDNIKDKFNNRGVDVVTVSMDSVERAKQSVDDWGIENVDVGYGLTEEQARDWGLFLSQGISDSEPDLFSEPGLFLVRPNGELYYSAVNSMPFGRPNLEEILGGIDFVQKEDYPARGEAR